MGHVICALFIIYLQDYVQIHHMNDARNQMLYNYNTVVFGMHDSNRVCMYFQVHPSDKLVISSRKIIAYLLYLHESHSLSSLDVRFHAGDVHWMYIE